MADYAGAVAAIEARLMASWAITPIAFANAEAPMVVAAGALVPWVYCEVSSLGSTIVGAGRPGDHVNRVAGEIEVMVYVPVGSGRATAMQHAVAIGEIFRVKEFYNEEPGACLRTWVPRVLGGQQAASENPDGNWWMVSVIIPFEFYHLA